MTGKVLTDIDSNGISEYAHFDNDGNLIGLQYEGDVEPIIEANKRAQNDGTRGYGKTREWRQIASIPLGVLLEYAVKRYGNNPEALTFMHTREAFEDITKKMLSDPDYRYLRTDI